MLINVEHEKGIDERRVGEYAGVGVCYDFNSPCKRDKAV
jgi:hypothetical protein